MCFGCKVHDGISKHYASESISNISLYSQQACIIPSPIIQDSIGKANKEVAYERSKK